MCAEAGVIVFCLGLLTFRYMGISDVYLGCQEQEPRQKLQNWRENCILVRKQMIPIQIASTEQHIQMPYQLSAQTKSRTEKIPC